MLLRRLGMRSSMFLIAASLSMIACSDKSSSSARANQQISSSDPARPQAKTSTVIVSEFRFRPENATVNLGDTVEWKNADAVPHAVKSEDGKTIQSGSIEKHASWSFKAEKEGTYEYQCPIHPTMKARLIVRSAQAGAQPKPSAAHAALTRVR